MINCQHITAEILSQLKRREPPKKILVAVLVGKNRQSWGFLKQKERAAKALGVNFQLLNLPETLSQKQLIAKIRRLSAGKDIGGLIIQLPLPKKFKIHPILNAVAPAKDADALNAASSAVLPPAAGALAAILKKIKFNPTSKKAVVVGAGLLVGKPIAKWLIQKKARLAVMDKNNFNAKLLKSADLIVSGAGVPKLIKSNKIKKGAIVIDYGYGKIKGKLSGDIDAASVAKVTKNFTPTPGGTGPLVVALLLKNFFELNLW